MRGLFGAKGITGKLLLNGFKEKKRRMETKAIVKEVLEKVWDATFDKEVGMRWKLLQIAEEYGVVLDRRLKKYNAKNACGLK